MRIVLTLVMWLSFNLHAEDIIVVTGDQYPPFTGKTLLNHGVLSEIVITALHNIEHVNQVSLVFEPWKRGYKNAQKAAYLGTFPYIKSVEREKDFLYSNSLFSEELALFIKAGGINQFNTIKSFSGSTACLPLGYSTNTIKPLIASKTIEIERPKKLENCFGMLKLGRVDFIPINKSVGSYFVRAHKNLTMDEFATVPNPFMEAVNSYFIISRKHPEADHYMKLFNFRP